MSKITFITFGCKVNTYETQVMRESFLEKGHTEVPDDNSSDIVVINSCTVTEQADKKLLKTLRRIRRENPGACIVLTGCYPQAHKEIPDGLADIVTGTKDRRSVADIVTGHPKGREKTVALPPPTADFESTRVHYSEGHTRAFVKIQDGCEMNCSYCIIPQARGKMRSKPPGELRAEIEDLAANGYKEIVLVGINIMFYGREYGTDIISAAECAEDIQGIERVRISSIEPEMMKLSHIERLAQCSKFCPSFHLSVQSGSDRILRLMKRKYDTARYMEIVENIRRVFPDASITTDIMTGFPTETEEDHLDSMRFARAVSFSDMHVFTFSPRQGTPAFDMEQVRNEIKHRRTEEMTMLGKELSAAFNKARIGSTCEVLFERERPDGTHRGHTKNYLSVSLKEKHPFTMRGKTAAVLITDADENTLYGDLI